MVSQLLRLANDVTALEDKVAALPTIRLQWEGREASAWRKWRTWQHDRLLRQAGFRQAASTSGYTVLPPVGSAGAAEADAQQAARAFEQKNPWSNMASVSGVIEWTDTQQWSGVYSTFGSST